MCRKFLLIFSVLVLGLATNAWAQAVANQDIGNPAIAGGVTTDGVTWNITGAGADIWGSWDQFHFVFRPLAGDGSGIVRVVSADCTYQWAKYGVMIRETLDGDSKHAAIAMTPEHGAQSLWRQETGGGSASAELAGVALPLYLKIERVGDVIMTAATWDLAFWIPQQTLTIPMNETVYIGMFVGSVSADTACTAVFDSVDLTAPEYNLAWNVSPADGLLVTDPEAGVTLSWMPGDTAASHNVHLGTTSPPDLAVNQTETTYNTGPLEGGQTYYWRIDEVEADGTTIHEGEERSFNTLRPGTGTILYERWEGIGDVVVPALTGHPDYPANPTYTTELTTFEAPLDIMDNYGARMIGWLHPETSGDYTFWISADDYAELHLSSTDSPVDAEIIANVPGWTSSREWGKYAEQQSAPISLTGGDKYYVMGIFKEGGGGDNCAVAWEGPDSPTMSIIDRYYLSPFVNLWAWGPNPRDGATGVAMSPTLSWQPAVDAVSYDVYVDGAPLGNTTQTSMPAGPFALSEYRRPSTHTWRVDTVADAEVRTGVTWSFTVSDHRVIDDFESYDVPPEGTAPQMVVGGDYTIVPVAPPAQEVIGGDYTIPGYTVEAVAPDDSRLLAFYELEGNGNDSSGNAHDCAEQAGASGLPTYEAGMVGQAIRFNGDGDHLLDEDAGDYLNGLDEMTISVWIKSDVIDTDKGFIIMDEPAGNDQRDMRYDKAGASGGLTNVIKYGVASDGASEEDESSGDVQTTEWQHLVRTWKSGVGMELYINGVLDTPSADDGAEGGVTDGVTKLIIGKGGKDSGDNSWDGLVDEVRIYNYALSEGEARYLAGVGDRVVEPVDVPPVYGPMVLHLEFEGDATDSSGNGRDGTLMGDAQFEAGPIGQALLLDGDGDYVNIDGYKGINMIDGVQQPFTIANWFKIAPGASDGNVEMVTWGTNAGRKRLTWRVHQGRLRTEHGAGNLRGNTYVDDDEWHHGALVVTEGANLRVPNTLLYIDGVQDSTFSGSDNPYELTAEADVRIGMNGPQNSRYWPGSIDDVRIYDYTLSDVEIRYLAGVPDEYVPPIYGPMRLHAELEGDLTDSTANANDGTMVGGDPVFEAGKIGQAIHLDGADDYVEFSDVGISGTDPRTVAAWVKADLLISDLPNWINLLGFTGPSGGNGHFDLEIVEAEGRRGYGIHVYGWERVIMDVDLEWHHLAASYDGTTIRWYGDGGFIGADSSRVLATPDNVHMGKRFDNANYWPGMVDDARIYDYALTDGQIAGLAGRAAENPITDTWSDWGLVDVSLESNAMRLDTYGIPGLRYYVGEAGRATPFADLTAGGGKALDVWFSGDPANTASALYMGLADADGASDTVVYTGDLATTEWQVWHIDMRDFEGVDESNASEIAIGLAGLDGGILGDIMLIDDLRVYASRCMPDLAKPMYDLNDDCVVDIADLEILIGEWGLEMLLQDYEERAAYWDERYPFNWGGDGIAMRDGLAAAGYTILDADQLKTWMDDRIADGKISVVVMARDSAPDTVAETMDTNCTLRKYLDAGGKVVWYADIPFYYQGHSDGTQTTWGEDGQAGILEIGNLALWDSGNTATITDAGAAWGLTQTWTSVRAEHAGDVDVVLATDNSGNAAAYVLHFVPGDAARGFVRLWDQSGGTTPPVEDVIRVAEAKGSLVADLNGDGTVGWADVFTMLDEWLDEVLWPY